MGPVEAAQTPENATMTGPPEISRRQEAGHSSGLPVCPGGSLQATMNEWQNLPTQVPKLAHLPGVLISYITREATGSSSLILRNT